MAQDEEECRKTCGENVESVQIRFENMEAKCFKPKGTEEVQYYICIHSFTLERHQGRKR